MSLLAQVSSKALILISEAALGANFGSAFFSVTEESPHFQRTLFLLDALILTALNIYRACVWEAVKTGL